MKRHTFLLISALFILAACKEKAAPNTVTAPAVTETTIATGIYQSAKEGDCLCVNSEKKIACLTREIESMGVSLGGDYDKFEVQEIKTHLQERYRNLKATAKDSVLDPETSGLFVKVKQATNCMKLNKPMGGPVAYEDYCIRD